MAEGLRDSGLYAELHKTALALDGGVHGVLIWSAIDRLLKEPSFEAYGKGMTATNVR